MPSDDRNLYSKLSFESIERPLLKVCMICGRVELSTYFAVEAPFVDRTLFVLCVLSASQGQAVAEVALARYLH